MDDKGSTVVVVFAGGVVVVALCPQPVNERTLVNNKTAIDLTVCINFHFLVKEANYDAKLKFN